MLCPLRHQNLRRSGSSSSRWNPRTSPVGPGKSKRLLLLAIPVALLLTVALTVVFSARRALNHANQAAASEGHLAFVCAPWTHLPIWLESFGSQTIASAPSYTTGAFFLGDLFLGGQSGLIVLRADGTSHLQPPLRFRAPRRSHPLPWPPAASVEPTSRSLCSPPAAQACFCLNQAPARLQPSTSSCLPRPPPATSPRCFPSPTEKSCSARAIAASSSTTTPPSHHSRFTLPGVNPATLQITALAAVDSAWFLIGTGDSGVFYVSARHSRSRQLHLRPAGQPGRVHRRLFLTRLRRHPCRNRRVRPSRTVVPSRTHPRARDLQPYPHTRRTQPHHRDPRSGHPAGRTRRWPDFQPRLYLGRPRCPVVAAGGRLPQRSRYALRPCRRNSPASLRRSLDARTPARTRSPLRRQHLRSRLCARRHSLYRQFFDHGLTFSARKAPSATSRTITSSASTAWCLTPSAIPSTPRPPTASCSSTRRATRARPSPIVTASSPITSPTLPSPARAPLWPHPPASPSWGLPGPKASTPSRVSSTTTSTRSLPRADLAN